MIEQNPTPPPTIKTAKDFKSVDEVLKHTAKTDKQIGPIRPKLAPSAIPKLDWNPVTSQGINTAEYNVPIDSVFERLNDGSYVAKFENHLGAEGNENRLANQQGFVEKAFYGVTKNASKIVNYVLDSTVGTVYGIYNGLNKGSFSAVWDNEFSRNMDDINKRLDYKLPNYYSDEEKSNNIFQSALTTNFWFNDVAGGLAFVGGAILPEVAIAALTGGGSAAGSFAKLGLKSVSKAVTKELAETSLQKTAKATWLGSSKVGKMLSKADDVVGYSQGRSILRGMSKAVFGSRIGGVLDTGAFLVRTSNFEAGMEARHNFKESVDNYMNSFEDINGRQPTYEELSKFMTSAKNGANTVYAANMAILSVSNAAMFGKTFDINILPDARKGVTNFFNKAIGLGVTTLDDGTRVLQKANRFQRIAGTTYKILEKPAIEGIFEEGLQGVAGKAMQKSMESLYDLDNSHSESMWSSLTDAFSEQYGSKEGWKEIGIGMIIGLAGGGIQPGAIKSGTAFSGFGKNSYTSTRKAMESDLATANEGLENLRKTFGDVSAPKGVTLLRAMTKASSASASRNNNTAPAYDNLNVNISFIQSQEHIKTQSEIQEDFEMVVDEMQISKEEQEQLQKNGLTVEQYKQSMINEFAQTSRDYLQAKAVVEALRVPNGITDGNLMNLKEAMIRNIVIGKQAQKNAQAIGRSIEETTGINGLYSAVEFYDGLSKEKKKATGELKKVTKERDKLFDTITQIQTQIAENKTASDNPKAKAKSQELQRKYLAATQRMAELEKKKTELDESIKIGKDVKKDLAGVSETDILSTLRVSTTKDAIDQLDKLDAYINDLENQGRTQEAAALKSSLIEYKAYANAHREFMNMHRRMTDTNFFNGEEGRGLLAKVFGKPYSMDPAFYDELKKNDEIIDKALRFLSIGSYEVAADYIKDALEKNPDLSDREKYRIEQMVRIQLQGILAQQVTNSLTDIAQTVEAVQEKPTSNILEGDSIQLRTALNLQVDEKTSLQVINEAIQTITSQIDAIQNTVRDTSKVQELEAQLAELKNQRGNFKEPTPTTPTSTQTTSNIDAKKADAQTVKNRMQEIEKQPVSMNVTTDASGKMEQTSEEVVSQIKSELDKIGLPYSDVVSNDKGSTYFVVTKDGKQHEILKLIKTGNALVKPVLTKAKWINHLIKTQPQNLYDFVNAELEALNQPTYNSIQEQALAQMKRDLEEEEKSLGRSQEVVDQLTQDIASLEEHTNEKTRLTKEELDAEIQRVEQELKDANQGIRIVESEDYIRFNELVKKQQTEGLTDAEQKEYDTLKNDIDQWLLVGGVITEGINLSDLIRQKVALENAKIMSPEVIQQRTDEDDLETIKFSTKGRNYNTRYGLTQDAVTVIANGKNNTLEINGIKADDEIVRQVFVELDADGNKVSIDFEYSFNEFGNIIIPLGENGENLAKVNSPTSLISVRPTNENLRTNYSVVIGHRKGITGEMESFPLKSVFPGEYNQTQDTQAIYDMQAGDEIILKVDTRDEYNQKLIQEYKDAKGKAAKKTAKENLRKNLRITASPKTTTGGKEGIYTHTLRGKQDNDAASGEDQKFEQFRDSIVNDKTMFDKLMDKTPALHVVNHGTLTVAKILPGQPNFNFSAKDENGNVTIQYTQFTDQMAAGVFDIGIRTSGGYKTKNGTTGLDTTFMSKDSTFKTNGKPNKKKEPFVVFKVGEKLIAYPVRLLPQEKRDNKEFELIFNSDTDVADKVVRLNQMLAQRGVDIKQPGEFFYSIGSKNNLTQEFFDKKMKQLEDFDYFYPLNEWTGGKTSIAELLKQQAQINLNTSSPFHSPKVEMDMKNMLKDFKVETTDEDTEYTDEQEEKAVKESKSPVVNKYKKAKDDSINTAAQEETDKNCNT